MANRIQLMRATLREHLEELGSPLDWEHISNQVGWVGVCCVLGQYLVVL
jgi:aspartate/tyrosine/aromatic aminotransferase